MTQTRTPQAIMEREFLELRAKILEIGASLDRIDRADGVEADTRQLELIYEGVGCLSRNAKNRAETIQQLFSRKYDEQWRSEFGI